MRRVPAAKRSQLPAQEWHQFLVPIPAEPPRPLTLRVWLAWLIHSLWTRATLYLSLLPGFMIAFARDGLMSALRNEYSVEQVIFALMLIVPIVTAIGAIVEAFTFASLVSRGVRVVTHARGVRAETNLVHTGRGYSFPVTDTGFEYQGGRDGVNIQGKWDGRIRFMREPREGQAMPVLFDRADPARRMLIWQFGLTTSLVTPDDKR